MIPPSALPRWLRLKPVAIFWSSVALGQQVAGELLDGELVERHVAVEGVDHPVAPAPHDALAVALVAVGVGVAGRVEPARRPSARRSGARRAGDRPPSRRRPATRSARKASTSAGVGGRPVRSSVTRRISVVRSASGDGVSPSASSRARTKRSIGFRGQPASRTVGGAGRRGGLEGPVRAPRRPLVDPAPQQLDLRGASASGPTSAGGITSSGSSLVTRAIELALGAPARHDDRVARRGARPPRTSSRRSALRAFGVGAVAAEAIVGEDRQDVAAEVHGAFRPGRDRRTGDGHREYAAQPSSTVGRRRRKRAGDRSGSMLNWTRARG